MSFVKRSIPRMYVYVFLTLGIYFLYWEITTKNEMNSELDANIPTAWLIIIPIANIYWLYKYTEGFVTKAKGDTDTGLWFILFWLVGGIIMPYVVQRELNTLADNPELVLSRKYGNRYCPNCGRNIPFNAEWCPYCAKKFEAYL